MLFRLIAAGVAATSPNLRAVPAGRAEGPPFWRQANAIGWHPTQTIICAVYPRSRRVPRGLLYTRVQTTIREDDANETSPP